MNFNRMKPHPELEPFIECYWSIEDESTISQIQKIIPDGYPEILFHHRDPWQINMQGAWELQPKRLLAGQVRRYFYLQNTGASGIIGIKLKPAALTQWFNLDMSKYTDKVIDLSEALGTRLSDLEQQLHKTTTPEAITEVADHYFQQFRHPIAGPPQPAIDKAVELIIDRKGLITIAEITVQTGISERQLERYFKKYVGLSPKYYARVIRFSAIFQYIQQGDIGWAGLANEAGYYDQSHFIRNFKAFTGEDPTAYGFSEANMANFFLQPPRQ